MRRYDESGQPTIREAFSLLTVDHLKPLAALVGNVPTKKDDLVGLLTRTMQAREKVRELYDAFGDMPQKCLQEATHDVEGRLDLAKFQAKYGEVPSFGGDGGRYARGEKPSRLRLFFPYQKILPSDLQELLRGFVPEPPALLVHAVDELPAKIRRPQVDLGSSYWLVDKEEAEPRIRHTAMAALHDVKAVLRLIDAGDVRVGDKTRRPSQAAMKLITNLLAEGDFYSEADQTQESYDPESDLMIQGFAWPMLLQAAGLAASTGTRLNLTPAGRKATAKPAHEVIRQIWEKWQKTTLVDEFNRINFIKGQQAKGRGLTAVVPRRGAIVEVLEVCPARQWIAIDELFRLLKVLAEDLAITHDAWKLYIAEQQYGSMGYNDPFCWEQLEGRFVLAFLFDYAATLGLVDAAYLSPARARNDFRGRWGTDALSCLSRYDGLCYFRINSLGAWCLGLAEDYESETTGGPSERFLQVLANGDLVAKGQPLTPADVLFLDRFCDRKSEAVWHLAANKVLEAVEKGMTVAELTEFLGARNEGPLPHPVDVLLADLGKKAGQLEDRGTARLIACGDASVAQLLAHDSRLRKLCTLAGDRQLVFRAADEAALRRALKELGYVLPPPR